MNWLDLIVIVLVGGLGLVGWRTGLIRGLMMLGGGVAGVALAGASYKQLAPALSVAIDSEGTRHVVAFAVVLLAVLVAAVMLGRIVRRTLQVLFLGWVDSAAGLAVGVFVGALGATASTIALGVLPVESLQGAVDDSSLAKWLTDHMRGVLTLLPQEFDRIRDRLR